MRELADAARVSELIDLLAQQIRRDVLSNGSGSVDSPNKNPIPWAIIGIKSRGDILAKRLASKLSPTHLGSVDITLYRDDLSDIGTHPVVRTTEIPFSVDGLNVVLVDDVFMTGRSVRAALAALMDLGRPRRVWLSVLVDRGGRELPIRPDHAAMDLSNLAQQPKIAAPVAAVSSQEMPGVTDRVEVRLLPDDAVDAIVVRSSNKAGGIR